MTVHRLVHRLAYTTWPTVLLGECATSGCGKPRQLGDSFCTACLPDRAESGVVTKDNLTTKR